MLIQHSLIDHNFAVDGGGDGGGVINFGGDGGAPGDAGRARLDDRVQHRPARRRADQLRQRGDAVTLESVTLARNLATDRGIGGVSVAPGSFQARGIDLLRQRVRRRPVELRDACRSATAATSTRVGDCGLRQPPRSPGLATDLTDSGGQTDVLPFALPSPAHDVGGACSALDQTDAARPRARAATRARGSTARPPAAASTAATDATLPAPTATPVPTPVPNRSVVVGAGARPGARQGARQQPLRGARRDGRASRSARRSTRARARSC